MTKLEKFKAEVLRGFEGFERGECSERSVDEIVAAVLTRSFIEKNLEWCFLAGGVLLVGGFVAVKFLH